MNARYTGHTIDGSKLFECDTAQQAGDAAADYMERRERAAPYGHKLAPLGYTYDNKPATARPYTVWRRDEGLRAIVGESFATFADVCAAWGRV